MEPRRLKKWLTVIAVVYLLFPRDLIPDFLGRGLGLLDDLLLIGLLIYFYRRQLRQHPAREARENGARDRGEPSDRAQAAASEEPFDPYQVLGIAPSASRETIQAAYKARMKEYHPDKVAHLGEDLQKLAHRKALEIQRAYQQLSP
jgi:uncharacterized membrane protein YkvA (DUF1232 family)